MHNKIKLVYMVPSLMMAGPENVLYDIISNLDREKYDVMVITLKRPSQNRSRIEDFQKLGVDIVPLLFNNYQLEFLTFWVANKVKKVLPSPHDCILHAHCYHPTLICSYLAEYKKIVTIHNISIEDFTLLVGNICGRYMTWRFNKTLKSYNKCVVISDYMYNYYQNYCCNNLVKINNGVNVGNKETKEILDIANKKKQLHKKLIVVVGRLSKRKNVSYIVKELKRLNRKDFVCLLIGIGEEYENVREYIVNDERFILLGYKKNVCDYLKNADIYISASLSEGFPLSVLEALNIGVPTLLSSIPPHQEIEENMSIDGVALFELLECRLSNLVDEFMNTEFNHSSIETKAKNIYSAIVMTSSYMDLYEKFKPSNTKD